MLKNIATNLSSYPSRYASQHEAMSEAFMRLNTVFDQISLHYNLPDHYDLNIKRYPWAERLLQRPQFYASRLWEYPWAVLESGVTSGMRCADVGCGQSPFTIYLKEVLNCEVTGFDPDYGVASNWYCHGVPETFAKDTGIRFVRSTVQQLDCPDNSFDVVFCISVIEHILDHQDRLKGIREIARVLKPGGVAVISVDVNLKQRIVNPLELIWESGLELSGAIDLRMPQERLGVFHDGQQPADVFGFVLRKMEYQIKTEYADDAPLAEAWQVAHLRDTFAPHSGEVRIPICYRPYLRDLQRNLKSDSPSLITWLRMIVKWSLDKYPQLQTFNL